MVARFEPNIAGLEEYAHTDEELAKSLLSIAEEGVAFAKGIAPVGNPANPQDDRHPGQYRDSFFATIEEFPRGLASRVVTDDPIALLLEYGSIHNVKFAVLRRTLDFMAGGG